ncbi:hypothetical protein ACFFQF_24670 [Haladaptatus pallidirubidus]|uniref:hypothetical protein n=1 Tax=Haladaptatus pallidirubidus TaxID=1008152 RepID=UPI001D0F7596|nr:hypothetical protein [Haladaptatus pallidirubidus]
MVTGLTDDDFRQIQKFAQTPRHQRTPELLCSTLERDDENTTSAQPSSETSARENQTET